MVLADLTAEYVRSILEYDPDTGEFHWQPRVELGPGWTTRWGGRKAGFAARGHIHIQINSRNYYAHRLAWLAMTGEWPADQIDHINGNRADNRFANLRLANLSENACNKRMQRNNTSGYVGVTFEQNRNKWRARINKDRKMYDLGFFDTPQEAAEARRAKLSEIHGEFARLNADVAHVLLGPSA